MTVAVSYRFFYVPDMIPAKPSPLSGYAYQGSALAAAMFAVVIVACLYFGREVFVPIALAVLLSFVLSPLVGLLQRGHVPGSLAVVVVVLIAFAALFSLGGLVLSQVNELAKDLPRYQSTFREKIQSLRGSTGGMSTFERAAQVLQDLSNELDRPSRRAPTSAPLINKGPTTAEPIP